ncbi:catalase-related domain-containing protein [Kitasatospora sp. NPDC057904]|uniref:catalase-related domain-containing protein n=1 Tax=unclassified Kitasatospora TaxID=2633591 RepID=UPI0036DC8379
MSDWEQEHIASAFAFELGKVGDQGVRRRMVGNLVHVDPGLAAEVARRVGEPEPEAATASEGNDTAGPRTSPALSLEHQRGSGVRTRKVAVLAAPGVDGEQVRDAHEQLGARGAVVETLAAYGGDVLAGDGARLPVDRPLPTVASVLYDALVVPDSGDRALCSDPDAVRFLAEAWRHGKPVALLGSGADLSRAAGLDVPDATAGVAVCRADEAAGPAFWEDFAGLVEQHRFPQR